MMKLGVHRALIVSSHTMAKECLLGVNDKVFVDRPHSIFGEHLAFNYSIQAFSHYGEYWREIRKVTTVELLSNHRVEMFKHIRVAEVSSGMKDLYNRYSATSDSRNSELVDMKQWFNEVSLNSSVRLICGKSLKEMYQEEKRNKISKLFREFFELAGVFVPADALPFLRWLDIGGYENAMKKTAVEIDQVAQEWLEEHKKRLVHNQGKENRDFMDAMLGSYNETDKDKPTNFGVDATIKANCLSVILASSDTTGVNLTWALSLLLNNKACMKKATTELDSIVGKERQVTESDLKDLTYLDAVFKETMRLYPAAPIGVPKVAIDDCTVNGYKIPAGTQLFVNIHKLQRDPEVWPNPLAFIPERFLTTHKDFDVRGKNFALIPFSSGRRMCPGITYAFKSVMLILASLLHGFDILTPLDETVDMTEGFGLTNLKTTPLEVILIPRLPNHIYNPPELAI